MGGSELGTNRKWPSGSDLYAIARAIEKHEIEGLLIIGGWSGYETAYKMYTERDNYPGLQHPDHLPARLDQQQPARLRAEHRRRYRPEQHRRGGGQDQAVGCGARRVFVVEVMGRYCGYLALMSGLATGAERVYIARRRRQAAATCQRMWKI